MKYLLILTSFLCTVLALSAGERFPIKSGKIQEWSYPAIQPKPGEKVYFECEAFIPLEKLDYHPLMDVRVNGVALERFTNNGAIRLVNKGGVMVSLLPAQRGQEWYGRGSLLYIFFKNSKNEVYKIFAPQTGTLFRFDVTDLVNRQGKNKVSIGNSFWAPCPFDLNIENPKFYASTPMGKELAFSLPEGQDPNPVKSWKGESFSASMGHGGDMMLKVNGEDYHLISEFSYPAQSLMKFNQMAPILQDSNNVTIAKDGSVHMISADGRYEVLRTVTMTDGVLKISDEIRNLSREDIGVDVRYLAVPNQAFDHRQSCIGGMDGRLAESLLGANPTLFVPQKKSALGIMAYDDILRAQMFAGQQQDFLFMETPNLGIPSGKSHTLMRLIRPQADTDYFTFVNALRRHLKRPVMTIYSGALMVNSLKPWLNWPGEEPKIDFFASGRWYDWETEWSNVSENDKTARICRQVMNDAKRGWPHIKGLLKLEGNLMSIDKRTIPGSEILPRNTGDRKGHYMTPLSEQQTALLKNHPLFDSFLKTADGRVMADCYYSVDPMLNMQVQEAVGNSRYEDMKAKFIAIGQMEGIDGIYMDQIVPEYQERFSYDRWDGISVELNHDGTIARKYTDFLITGVSARAELVRLATENGKILMANRHPTSEVTSNIPHYRFGEQDEDFRQLTARDSLGKAESHPNLTGHEEPGAGLFQGSAQLSVTPVVLLLRPQNFKPGDTERYHTRALVSALRHGILAYNYTCDINPDKGGYGVIWDMFPITITEMGRGFVIGKERIISCISRTFTTPLSDKAPTVREFDDHGRLKKILQSKVTQLTDKTWKVDLKLNDWNETAAIIFN